MKNHDATAEKFAEGFRWPALRWKLTFLLLLLLFLSLSSLSVSLYVSVSVSVSLFLSLCMSMLVYVCVCMPMRVCVCNVTLIYHTQTFSQYHIQKNTRLCDLAKNTFLKFHYKVTNVTFSRLQDVPQFIF